MTGKLDHSIIIYVIPISSNKVFYVCRKVKKKKKKKVFYVKGVWNISHTYGRYYISRV